MSAAPWNVKRQLGSGLEVDWKCVVECPKTRLASHSTKRHIIAAKPGEMWLKFRIGPDYHGCVTKFLTH
jgi:hypothetical protein